MKLNHRVVVQHNAAGCAMDTTTIFDNTTSIKTEITAIRADCARLLFNLAAGNRVMAADLADLLARAAAQNLVHRDGMTNSGLKFPGREKALVAMEAAVPHKDAMDCLTHLFAQSRRTENILNNPNGYTSSPYHRIYGGREEGRHGWKPLFD